MKSIEKKRLWMFIAIAYGVTVLMSLLMIVGKNNGKDLTAFVNVQMAYPMCGVILGKLFFREEDKKLPMAGYITVLVTTAIMMVLAILSVFLPEVMIDNGITEYSNWNIYSQYVLIAGSFVAYILFWVCGKEKRANAGLSRNKVKLSILLVLLFIVLYLLRSLISSLMFDALTGGSNIDTLSGSLMDPTIIRVLIALAINFPLTFIAFMGEEYGWRYYLQPIMQKKFGLRLGVLLLGLVWAVWHIFVDYLFYAKETGLQMFVSQIITCVAMAIFFGYAFMKTENIWAISIMHYINNNMIAVFAGGDANVLQNQTVTWGMLPIMLVQNILFFLFILAPVYGKLRKDKEEQKNA